MRSAGTVAVRRKAGYDRCREIMKAPLPARTTSLAIPSFAAISLIVGAFAAVYLPPMGQVRSASISTAGADTVSVGAALKRCEDGVPARTCLLNVLRAKADADGPEAAFADLKVLYDTNVTAHGFCHQLSHEIGHAGYRKYGNIAAAFEHGDSFCWSGYHHGVLESYVQEIGVEELPKRLPTVCDGVPGRESYTFGFFNCVHGLGHGLMAVTDDKVDRE